MRSLIKFFLIACVALPAGWGHAQYAPANFTRQAYELFAAKSAHTVETAWLHNTDQLALSNLLHGYTFRAQAPLNTAYTRLPALNVRTNDRRWMYANVNFQNVFSAQEKALLLHHETPFVNLGKIAFTFDRTDALFLHITQKKNLTGQDVEAFKEHQAQLQMLFDSLDVYYKSHAPSLFSSPLFPEEEIKNMLFSTTVQPAAYMFHMNEFEAFAKLPDLDAQKKWIAENKQVSIDALALLQNKPVVQLQREDFTNYYVHKVRLDYLKTLESLLANATKKRPSLLFRRKQTVEGFETAMTDAERLGFLKFQADTNPSVTNNALFQTQFELYARYAAAEALEAPYEVTLRGDYFAPELLGEEKGARLRNLTYQQAFKELNPKVKELKAQLKALQAKNDHTPQIYKAYYAIYAEIQIYETLLAKATVQKHFE